MQIDSFADLLNLSLDGLALDSATLALTETAATITTHATVFGVADQQVRVLLRAQDGKIVPSLAVDFPPMSLRQLAEAGYLPPSTYAPAELPAITFANIQAAPDAANRVVTVTGSATGGALTLGV